MNVRQCVRAMAAMLLVFLSCFLIFPQEGAASPVSGDVQSLPELQQPPGGDMWNWGDPVPDGGREWTIIAYIDGDNNLENFALSDLKEMESGYPGPMVEVIVLLDRAREYSTAMGNWTGTRAYRLKKSAGEETINSELLFDFGELNLGDGAVLEAFLRETLRKYPAKKTALFMWDHGSGWINMANDDDAPGTQRTTDEITLDEFTAALKSTAPLLPGGQLDLVFFDMCLMGQAETVTACAPYAKYMVGAPPTIPGVGMDYAKALPLFRGNNSTADIAAELVRTGVRGFGENGRKDGAYTAFNLSKTDEFLTAFSVFSNKLAEKVPSEWANITRTIFYSQNYGGRGDYLREKNSLSSIDLRDWLSRLRKIMKSPPSAEIEKLEKALGSLIIAAEKGPMLTFSRGIDIYVPLRENTRRTEYAGLEFNRRT